MTATETTATILPTLSGLQISVEGMSVARLTYNGQHAGFININSTLYIAEHGDWVAEAHNTTGTFRVSMTELVAVILSQTFHMEMDY